MLIRRVTKLSPPIQPTSIEVGYTRQWQGWVKAWDAGLKEALDNLPPQWGGGRFDASEERFDAFDDEFTLWINRFMAGSVTYLNGVISTQNLSKVWSDTSLFNWRVLSKQVKERTGRTLPAIYPWQEKGIAERAAVWMRQQTSLITNFDLERRAVTRDAVWEAVSNGWSARALKRSLLEKLGQEGLSGSRINPLARAELIAVDQILTANSSLTQQRHANAGVNFYFWRGMMDNRERPAHKFIEGWRFRVDGMPIDAKDMVPGQSATTPSEVSGVGGNYPGRPVRCRCFAEPDFTGSIWDEENDEQATV